MLTALYILPAILILAAASPATALPHEDGIVFVGDRQFFVGALTSSFGDDARSFDLRHAPWLKKLLDSDPLLADQNVRFLRSGVPAPNLIGKVSTQLRDSGRLEDDPHYMAEGHDVVTFGERHEYIYPKDSPITYSVFCTRGGFNPGELNICDIAVAYPYGTNVVLTARQYFPGKLPEISATFEPIAARMTEIATCLDVTDKAIGEGPSSETAILDHHPDLTGCTILLSS